ncbi:MAG: type II toxin-antitoxin system VapC family toxin [Planctomycetes bacterium]|nr:type II toxin-antitoxin system VapC family toxin [Planctomycetota bacterium]
MASVYLETTIISYLTARPSRDLIVAAHQQITRDWWDRSSHKFSLFISEVVLRELQAGDPDAAGQRLQVAEDIALLSLSEDVETLARIYHAELKLPPKAANDVLHIAFAVAYKIDYLLTWNCAHIANGHTIKRLSQINDRIGRSTPVIIMPEELLEE